MPQSLMYCSEQIAIPETFPNILKTYAKAAIRTQPYDLLRWSTAYFRCLAQNEPPPAKCRLEKEAKSGSVTKGLLRVLLNQVGKGFFISRQLLQKKWEDLCLPEEELLKYLSVCRMLNWHQVHWLKLFVVMVGSLNKSPMYTMDMLCELLTEDVEGSPAYIPMWMARVVYTFLSELDCSERQTFVNGRKQLNDGKLEDETVMDNIPKVFSTTSLKQAILGECLQRYNETNEADGQHLLDNESQQCSSSCSNTHSSSLSSGFQFVGKFGDTKQIIQKCGDFDSLILLLREAQGAKLHEYEGPYHISTNNIEHAKKREATVNADREHQEMLQEENTRKYLHQERLNMLREMGSPWSWIHQFANSSCLDMSYNFIEERSIASDVTPPESSDESFDFLKEKPITEHDTESETPPLTMSSDNVENLIEEEKTLHSDRIDKQLKGEDVFQNIRNVFLKAESEGEIDVSVTGSILSYINKDEMGVLQRAGERAAPTFDLQILDQILREAMENGIVFGSIDEVMGFVKNKYDDFTKDTQTGYFVNFDEGKIECEDHPSEGGAEEEFSISGGQSVSHVKLEPKQVVLDEAVSEDMSHTEVKEERERSNSEADDDDDDVKSAETVEIAKTTSRSIDNAPEIEATLSESVNMAGEIETVFESCGIEPDSKELAKRESKNMIIGLVDRPAMEKMGEEENAESSIEPTQDESSRGGYATDISNNDASTIISADPEIVLPAFICGVGVDVKHEIERPDYVCIVPAYPGIGKSVSKKTIQDFVTYLKFRSRNQKGLVLPRNFREDKCPKMVDCDLSTFPV